MISSRPQPPGTAAFRPVVGGLPRPHVAAGFRPVVAGQYLRADRQQEASPFTFLIPPPVGPGDVHLSVVVSPRIVWQVMNAIPADATTWRIGGGFGTVAGKTRDSVAATVVPVANPFELLRDTTGTTPATSGGGDRLLMFRTSAASVSGSLPSNDGSRRGTENRPNGDLGNGTATARSTTVDRFTWLRDLVGTDAVGTNHLVHSRGDPAVRAAAMTRDSGGYSPVALTPRNGADNADDQTDTAPRNASWESAFAERLGRSRTAGSDTPATAANRRPRGGDKLSVDVVVGRTLRRFAGETTLSTLETIRQTSGTRESTTAQMTFGRTAKVGAGRPAALVPAIYRVSPSEAGTESVLAGSRTAAAFAASVVGRLVRSDAGGTPTAFASPVPAVVRTRGASAAAPGSIPAEPTTFRPDSAPQPPSPPPGLPPDLVQRLTEPVVRSLDARALAARERTGRF